MADDKLKRTEDQQKEAVAKVLGFNVPQATIDYVNESPIIQFIKGLALGPDIPAPQLPSGKTDVNRPIQYPSPERMEAMKWGDYGGLIGAALPVIPGRLLKYLTPAGKFLPEVAANLQRLAKAGEAGKDWYQNTYNAIKQIVGDEQTAKQLVEVLSATSQNASVPANVSLSVKAHRQLKAGEPPTGYLPGVIEDLIAISKGEEWGGPKRKAFTQNLMGDPNPVVIDRHIMRALGDKRHAPGPKEYAHLEKAFQQLAEEAGMEPRQLQAAVWDAVRREQNLPDSMTFEDYLKIHTEQPSLFSGNDPLMVVDPSTPMEKVKGGPPVATAKPIEDISLGKGKFPQIKAQQQSLLPTNDLPLEAGKKVRTPPPMKQPMPSDKRMDELVDKFGGRPQPQQAAPISQLMPIEHYSNIDNLTVVDPAFMGTGSAGEEAKRKGRIPRSYFYEGGTKPETIFARRPKYTGEIDPTKIYDIGTDPLKLRESTPFGDLNALEEAVKAAGYSGYKNSSAENMANVIAIFDPVKVKRQYINPDVQALIAEYTGGKTISPLKKVDPSFGMRVSDAYERMPHAPSDPAVASTYNSFIDDVNKQWDLATSKGFSFEPTGNSDPYGSSSAMFDDLAKYKRLKVYEGVDMPPDHPLAGVDPKTGLTYNTKFRGIHDLFGHAGEGFQFGPVGETNATLSHARMFPENAIPALNSETIGQNSFVNYGPHMRNPQTGSLLLPSDPSFLPQGKRPFSQQKAGVLPTEIQALIKALGQQ